MEAHGQPLRGLRWAGGASLPFLRTEMPLRDIPVFRMAYFTIKPYYGLISKTLMLQVRSAHPPIPHRNVFFKTFRCSARLIRQAETLELQPRSRPPSSHTMAFAPKRSTSRFAPLTLRCRTEMFFQNIPVFRSAYFPIPHRPTFDAPVFRSAYSASRNARAPAASRPSVGGGSFAPPCTPLSRRPPDTGRTASKAPLEGSWRAAPEGWVRHGDAQFRGIEERRFRLRLTGLHAFCRRQRLWNQSV